MLFGFNIQHSFKLKSFSFNEYLKQLDTGKEEIKQSLKIYYFAQKLLEVSPLAKKLIQDALTGNMTLKSFYEHQFFQEPIQGRRREQNITARQVKMLGQFSMQYQSLVMAAIDHKKKFPDKKLLPSLPYALEMTPNQIVNYLNSHAMLRKINFDHNFKTNNM